MAQNTGGAHYDLTSKRSYHRPNVVIEHLVIGIYRIIR